MSSGTPVAVQPIPRGGVGRVGGNLHATARRPVEPEDREAPGVPELGGAEAAAARDGHAVLPDGTVG